MNRPGQDTHRYDGLVAIETGLSFVAAGTEWISATVVIGMNSVVAEIGLELVGTETDFDLVAAEV